MGAELTMLFQDGKRKALTFSYDDGTVHDRKLVSLMNQYGMKGTFNLNSGLFGRKENKIINGINTDFSRIEEKEAAELYRGHEVASHTANHSSLTGLSKHMGAAEILKDRHKLEEMTGELVRGFAYPYGSYNEQVEEILNACGIEYARTVCSTNEFELPQDFLEWHPTCHHESPLLMELAERFCKEDTWYAQLFYLWGHSYEFAQKDNWQIIEDFMKYVSAYRDNIWFATNLEIADYVEAFRELRCSTDGRILYNPTGITLWFELDREIHCIHGNEKYGPV
jgi:hypothetical protein